MAQDERITRALERYERQRLREAESWYFGDDDEYEEEVDWDARWREERDRKATIR